MSSPFLTQREKVELQRKRRRNERQREKNKNTMRRARWTASMERDLEKALMQGKLKEIDVILRKLIKAGQSESPIARRAMRFNQTN